MIVKYYAAYSYNQPMSIKRIIFTGLFFASTMQWLL